MSCAAIAAAIAAGTATMMAWGTARADVCSAVQAPWLRVDFAGDAFTPALRAQVLAQLGANLDSHGISLCDGAGTPVGPPPLADISLTLSPGSVLSLEVRDAVTDKRMLRDLPLGAVPRDALGLSIALAAEELLHASWIEAALAPPPTATPAPPGLPAVPRAVQEVDAEQVAKMPEVVKATRPRTTSTQIALMAAGDATTKNETDLGADLRVGWGGRFAVAARAGFRATRDVGAPDGTIHGQHFLVGLSGSYALVPRERPFGGDVGVRVDALYVHYAGTAGPGGVADNGSKPAVVASGVLEGWARIAGPLRVVAEGSAGAPVLGVTASDSNRKVTGLAGAAFGVALGVGVSLE
jgi:hypothetical protein